MCLTRMGGKVSDVSLSAIYAASERMIVTHCMPIVHTSARASTSARAVWAGMVMGTRVMTSTSALVAHVATMAPARSRLALLARIRMVLHARVGTCQVPHAAFPLTATRARALAVSRMDFVLPVGAHMGRHTRLCTTQRVQ